MTDRNEAFEKYIAERTKGWEPTSPLWQGSGAIVKELQVAYEAGGAAKYPEGPKTPVSSKTSVKGCSDDYKELIDRLEEYSRNWRQYVIVTDGPIRDAIKALTSQGERIAELEGALRIVAKRGIEDALKGAMERIKAGEDAWLTSPLN